MNKGNKFLFDLNKFDEPEDVVEEEIIEEEIEVEPPPPTFSEEEMEAAKIMAKASGRNEGMAEERGKREQNIADIMKEISDNFQTIFAAENYREKQYEDEATKLAIEIIDQIAPTLIQRFGQTDLKKVLGDVLVKQSGQSEIRIEINPDNAAEIDRLLEDLWEDNDHAPRYKVVANSEIGPGGCQLNWKDGGMVRTPEKTAAEIKNKLEELLNNRILENMAVKPANKPPETVTDDENNAIKESEQQSQPDPATGNPTSGEINE